MSASPVNGVLLAPSYQVDAAFKQTHVLISVKLGKT
jgi:hypothetical protein